MIGSIIPMEPVLHQEAFNDPNFIFEVKWDGVRILALVDRNTVQLVNKRQRRRTEQYPELLQLTRLVTKQPAILDGEVVALKNGLPSFPAVIQRDRCSSARSIKSGILSNPINYMVFDILYCQGRSLLDWSLSQRKELLDQIIRPNNIAFTVDGFVDGEILFTEIKKRGMEGMVAKRKASPYTQGKHHHDWFKIKNFRYQMCVIGGYTMDGNRINSLLLGAFREKQLVYVGKAGTGLKANEWEVMAAELEKRRINHSPFVNLISQKGGHFVQPQICVKVKFLEWTEHLHLRSPVIVGFSSLHPDQCQI
ncbi:MAG: non-homologous end-joining DNA ligase [Syntrophomonadaceae bacterium]|jgi:bifunctional non-homologous end joining protein LigD